MSWPAAVINERSSSSCCSGSSSSSYIVNVITLSVSKAAAQCIVISPVCVFVGLLLR